MSPGRQSDIGAKRVPDLLVGLLGFAEPQLHAFFDIRTQHVSQDLLRLIDHPGRDLKTFAMDQDAQRSPQFFQFRPGNTVAAVQAVKDRLQALLNALTQRIR